MPLGKYFCDYCEKQFQDTPSARKRHLQGVQHQRSKALWYNNINNNSLRDANQQFHPDSFGRGLCNRFLRTGSCPYGDSCKYFHPKLNLGVPDNIQSPRIPENQLAGGPPFPGAVVGDGMGISLGNLPPSLKPPPEGGYPPFPYIDWG
ncbi:Zinc finger CCCH domain-containing protein 3 [Camellia lanceoleosa]|uniref:Zinc finger CCCH domain-containing protein 3 n=1 Tax=Camellia lanceoleosa TaxID=1840588 RepID=A0ACC0ID11_9ERIC|nr:Zinc finger CCCH domain-containing protein 3 [Camellia lanceoleosa]